MEEDCYKVEVVHFVNPHLIWVKVEGGKAGEFVFEQVGIYGVLPMEMYVDLLGSALQTRRSLEWMPAANVLMKHVLDDALEVKFFPVFIDERSSIFDNNIHKYGELIIKKPNGKYRFMSELLKRAGYVVSDENLFHSELNSGNLQTNLTHHRTADVIRHLEKVSREQVKKQANVHYMAKNIESALTIQNLEAHNRTNDAQPFKVAELLQRKVEHLKLCKESDSEAVGRASKRNKDRNIEKEHTEERVKQSDLHGEMFQALTTQHTKEVKIQDATTSVVQKFLRQREKDRAAMNLSYDSESEPIMDATENMAKTLSNSLQKLRKLHAKLRSDIVNNNEAEVNINREQNLNNCDNIVNMKIDSLEPVPEKYAYEEDIENQPVVRVKKAKNRKTTNKDPECDVKTQAVVRFGPAGANFQDLADIVVPKDSVFEAPALLDKERAQEEKEGNEKKANEDLFSNVDSDEEVDFSYKLFNVIKDAKVKQTGPEQEAFYKNVSNVNVNKSDADSNLNNDPKLIDYEKTTIISPNPFFVPKTITSNHGIKVEKDSDTKTATLPNTVVSKDNDQTYEQTDKGASALKRKLRVYRDLAKHNTSSKSMSSDTSIDANIQNTSLKTETTLDSDDDSSILNESLKQKLTPKKPNVTNAAPLQNHVNPFRNCDPSLSVFVEKLITPVLMVHSKMDKRFLPAFSLRDIPFNPNIQRVLKNMGVVQPMTIQTVTWTSILRGYSTFIVSPKGSGKTVGYLPAVCRMVSDKDTQISGNGPVSLIVCATSYSVSEVKNLARAFLKKEDKVVAFYPGMDDLDMTTALLNGCDVLICTPKVLGRLIGYDLGLDLRRLTTFVIDDCERISEVYAAEITYAYSQISKMLLNRIAKEVSVQIILASRIWCDFMRAAAVKAPNPVICIGAFQECVLYSKANTTATFVNPENKVKSVLEFLNTIDLTKRTVVACRSDDEVKVLSKSLLEAKHTVIACDSTMTVQDLYNIRGSWNEKKDSLIGPILVCLDDNLSHMNVTDAHYLVHYSLPNLFSMFCKRFAVLTDHYPSIFKKENETVKIKILLEQNNVEQLPKILHFIKRCTTTMPEILEAISEKVLLERDVMKAKKLVPICDSLLALGDCPDFWNCQERHAIFKEYDEPKDWMPKDGIITFKILYYHTAVYYSASLLTHVVNGKTEKYPQNLKMVGLKLSMYYSRDSNRQLIGAPKVGDVCAVAITQNFFARCRVVKILDYYQKGNPFHVLVRLIDQEKYERVKDIDLYYLPEELKKIETYVLTVRLANVEPKHKDITFSDLAKYQLKAITDDDDDLYLRGQVGLSVSNCVFVETLEACRDLSSLNKTVVRYDYKEELRQHSVANPKHLPKLQKLCEECGLVKPEVRTQEVDVKSHVKTLPKPQWAHLEKDDLSAVLFASAVNPRTFFVRLTKFEDSCDVLVKDIEKYVKGNPEKVVSVSVGDIVLAKLPDDGLFERARIDEIIDDSKVKCFFVDQGDWRIVFKQHLIQITEKFITQLPFQAIECKLIGVKPPSDNWTEFATNWFTNCFEDNDGNLKAVYAQYFTKEKPLHTSGHKYGIALIDTNSTEDIIINDLILQLNLAEESDEIEYLEKLVFSRTKAPLTTTEKEEESGDDVAGEDWEKVSKSSSSIDVIESPKANILFQKPIRSVPLVGSDESDEFDDKWDVSSDIMDLLKPQKKSAKDFIMSSLPAIKNSNSSSSSSVSLQPQKRSVAGSQSSSIQVIPSPKIKGLDSKTADSLSNSSAGFKAQNPSVASTQSCLLQITPKSKIKELDSDDLSSLESNLASSTTEKRNVSSTSSSSTSKSSTVASLNPVIIPKSTVPMKTNKMEPIKDELRKPKLMWRQNSKNVTIKILIICDDYVLKIEDNGLKFHAEANDTTYGFNVELYGVVDSKTSKHSNKGQYILISLTKVLQRNWFMLTRSCLNQKWIVYDVESIDISSDEEKVDDRMSKEVLKNMINDEETESDDDFVDDAEFVYKR